MRLPSYVIFSDSTLRDIATRMPTTLGELSSIRGVGKARLELYGDSILTVLSDGRTH
jgi:ATP-dependent DNA helicase RecQ